MYSTDLVVYKFNEGIDFKRGFCCIEMKCLEKEKKEKTNIEEKKFDGIIRLLDFDMTECTTKGIQ